MKMKVSWIFVIGLILLLSSPLISSVNIGISPAKIYFEDVLRGGYSERPITITVDSPEDVEITLESRGEIESWINYSGENFKILDGQPQQVIISVTPPTDVPNGNYSGFLRIKTKSEGNTVEGHATGIINTALDLYIEVEIVDTEIMSCNAKGFTVESVEKGDELTFKAKILNEGNVILSPRIEIEIWDENQIEIVKKIEFEDKPISPSRTEELLINTETDDLEIGQYWAKVSAIDCYSSQTLTFDIMEEGAIRSKGELKSINVNPWAEINEIVPISVFFENQGEKSVGARFKGKITLGDKIVQIIESDEPLQVSIGDTEEFKFYFTPQKEGKYIFTGQIFYDGKRTFEKSAIINVVDNKIKLSSTIIPLVYLSLLGFIIILIYKIKKEKKINLRRLFGR